MTPIVELSGLPGQWQGRLIRMIRALFHCEYPRREVSDMISQVKATWSCKTHPQQSKDRKDFEGQKGFPATTEPVMYKRRQTRTRPKCNRVAVIEGDRRNSGTSITSSSRPAPILTSMRIGCLERRKTRRFQDTVLSMS